MRSFDYSFLKSIMVDGNVLNLVVGIERFRERDSDRYIEFPRTYEAMEQAARLQSVFGSNAIEGIVTSDDRLKAICMRKVEPVGHTEEEIAGYRDALDLIHREHSELRIDTDTILMLYGIMTSRSDPDGKGIHWKDRDNVIGRRLEDGTFEVHFRTMRWQDVPEAMERLVAAYDAASQDMSVNRLLLIPCFILDFLSIHPFIDSNGRMSRLLSLLMLYREGYDAGRYVSFEDTIYRHRPDYYRALSESSEGWHEGRNDYMPFIRSFLDTLFLCYKELDRRFAASVGTKDNKSGRVENAIMNSVMPMSRRELQELLPDISDQLITKVLARLVGEGRVERIGAGPATRYRRRGSPSEKGRSGHSFLP